MFSWLRNLFRPEAQHTVNLQSMPFQFIREDEDGPYVINVDNVPVELITPTKLERLVGERWDEAQKARILNLDWEDIN